MMKNSIDSNTTSTPFPKEQLLQDIKEFLELQSKGLSFTDIYKESMKNQGYFTATNEQFKDNNWKPDSTKGLEDNSFVFFPVGRVGQIVGNGTKEISPIIIQKGGQVYDDMGRKANLYLNTELFPVIKSEIELTKFIGNNIKSDIQNNPYKYLLGVEVANDFLNPSMPSTTPYGQIYYMGDNLKNILNNVFGAKNDN